MMQGCSSFHLSLSSCLLLLVISIVSRLSSGSPADRTRFYLDCTNQCERECLENGDVDRFPFELKLLQWDCKYDCRYTCMWNQEEIRKEKHAESYKALKYFGKWPFERYLGMQEIASVFFSLGNAFPHVWYLLKRKDRIAPRGWYMSKTISTAGWIYVTGWLCSAVFHSRDLPLTEKMDYFSAVLMITFSIWGTFLRMLGPFSKRPVMLSSIALALILWYLRYVYFMTYILFDYGYTVKVSIAFGLFNVVQWIIHIIKTRRRYQWKLLLTLVWTHLALLLEVFDFPPWLLIFDSHSLWHAVTIPVGFLWYQYVIDDASYEIRALLPAKAI